MTTIQAPAPVQKAMIAKIKGRLPGAIVLSNCAVAEPMQYEGERAGDRIEHEQPDDHARSAGESSRDVEDEAEDRADALGQVVEHQREPHDEDRLADQPDEP